MNSAHKAPCTALHISHTRTHTHNTSLRTYVIVIVVQIVFLVNDHFFHSESLLLVSVSGIDGTLPQIHRQMSDSRALTEQKNKHIYVNIHLCMCKSYCVQKQESVVLFVCCKCLFGLTHPRSSVQL